MLDGHLDKIARAAWWMTGLVVASGIYNLVNSVAYRVPLSPDQVSRLFRLPYAQPYYLSLAVKLAAYAVMIGATIPLIAEARRRAAIDEADVVSLPDDNDPSPWVNPERPAGPVAVRTKRAAALEADWARSGRVRRSWSGSGGDHGGRRRSDHHRRHAAQVFPSPGGAVSSVRLRSPGS